MALSSIAPAFSPARGHSITPALILALVQLNRARTGPELAELTGAPALEVARLMAGLWQAGYLAVSASECWLTTSAALICWAQRVREESR